jgi:hypothetical protein
MYSPHLPSGPRKPPRTSRGMERAEAANTLNRTANNWRYVTKCTAKLLWTTDADTVDLRETTPSPPSTACIGAARC